MLAGDEGSYVFEIRLNDNDSSTNGCQIGRFDKACKSSRVLRVKDKEHNVGILFRFVFYPNEVRMPFVNLLKREEEEIEQFLVLFHRLG